ncbi:unnamed protein product [Urochloa humidicola]
MEASRRRRRRQLGVSQCSYGPPLRRLSSAGEAADEACTEQDTRRGEKAGEACIEQDTRSCHSSKVVKRRAKNRRGRAKNRDRERSEGSREGRWGRSN